MSATGRRARVLPFALLAIVLAVSIVLAVGLGSTRIAAGDVMRTIAAHAVGRTHPADMNDAIVWMIRVPRVLLGALVGAALAVAGAVLQAATSNRLADPHLLGVSAGASVGAVAATLWIGAAWGVLTLPVCAFAGALAATALVIACGARGGRVDAQRLLLAGVAISFVLMALANLLLYLGDQRAASSVLFWMLGGLGLARWNLLDVPAALVGISLILLIGRRRELDALMSGDVVAVTLGVNVTRLRRELFVVCSLLTAGMVAVSGAIGFVGLVAPHAARRLVGAGHARLLPTSALVGAIMLVWADVAARTLISPDDLPIGVVTGLFGGIFFVWLVRSPH
ncbi:iron ABC transporter permease [Paraburkholderia sp. Ac-20336]|uniref:FecCD family ABC transporter permease n=1 Tax=Burkholderiaceae TaxID=119060 RepID=UPI0014230A23|nr:MULTISPECIES: iron ABC transporter permease [Burkholderiaceae]MBN3801733.1 iron ABC transporter permease [Paraburkholderia sp. Ac-20336]MBN3845613.1 iron ABC transporter permease [Paraburkholderia sp. Ac-20342]NIF51051.1 iron ABC transporter permease [Burkholderia sp. Ax-1724]